MGLFVSCLKITSDSWSRRDQIC